MIGADISFLAFSGELTKLAKDAKLPISKADLRIFKTLLKGSPVKVKLTDEAHMYGGGYFDQVKKEIGLSDKNFSTLAHELGHADIDKNILGRIIQSRAMRLAYGFTPLAGIGAAMLLAKGKKWGLILPTALAAPTLLSEALASIKGHGKLTDAKATDEQKSRARGDMLRGFGSYTIAPAIATALASVR